MNLSAAEAAGLRRKSAKSSCRGFAIAAAVVVVLLILVAVCLGSVSGRRCEAYLSGLWVGDPSFLEQAQLRDLQLFLAPREPRGGERRQGYLIMTDLAGNFISNQAIELRVGSAAKRWWTALKSAFRAERDTYKASCVELELDSPVGDPPMPARLKMSLSILDGTLALYDDEKVYAFLQKDLLASAAAVAAYKS